MSRLVAAGDPIRKADGRLHRSLPAALMAGWLWQQGPAWSFVATALLVTAACCLLVTVREPRAAA